MRMGIGKWVVAVAAAGALVLAAGGQARATELNCALGCTTTGAGGTTVGFFDGALFLTTFSQSTGTGVIDSFVRIDTNTDVEGGLNTSSRQLSNDENSSPQFTRDLQLINVPIVTINGVQYYEFLLDINQTGVDPLLSLDDIIVCTAGSGGLDFDGNKATNYSNAACPSGAASKFNLPTGDWINMDYNLNSGSGSGDLFMYLPVSLFSGVSTSSFVYLWSTFGIHNNNNDGFEEWAVQEVVGTPPLPPIPEPASLLLFGTGLAGVARLARKRMGTTR